MKSAGTYFLNVAAQSIGRVGSFAANFLVFILIARLWGAELFGQYSYILTFLSICIAFADFGMTSVLGKDIAQVGDSAGTYWGSFLLLRTLLNFLVVILATATAYYLRKDIFPALLLGSLSLPLLAARFFEPVFQVYHRPWFSTYSSVSYAIVYLFLSILVLFYTKSLTSLVLAFLCANAVYSIVAFCLSWRVIKPSFKPQQKTSLAILKLSLPLGVSSIFAMVGARIAIFMLADIKTDYDVAMYNAAYRFLELSGLFIGMVINPLLPIFSEKAKYDLPSLRRNLSIIFECLAVVLLPLAIACPVISPALVALCFGHEFMPAVPLLNIFAWVGVLLFYSLLASAATLSVGVVHFAYWNTALAAVLSIVCNYLLIPKYGAIGSASVALLCEMFLSTVTIFYMIRHMGNIFRCAVWSKIIIANAVLYLLLNTEVLPVHAFVRLLGGIPAYVVLILFMGVVSKESLEPLWKMKQSELM